SGRYEPSGTGHRSVLQCDKESRIGTPRNGPWAAPPRLPTGTRGQGATPARTTRSPQLASAVRRHRRLAAVRALSIEQATLLPCWLLTVGVPGLHLTTFKLRPSHHGDGPRTHAAHVVTPKPRRIQVAGTEQAVLT